MNINDEAVEAAAKVWLRLSLKQGSWTLEGNVRAALEAAAPHLMAVAWERGREDGYHHRPNPYRSAGSEAASGCSSCGRAESEAHVHCSHQNCGHVDCPCGKIYESSAGAGG